MAVNNGRSELLEPQYPVTENESEKSKWSKYIQEIARLYRLLRGHFDYFDDLINGIINGDTAAGKTKGSLTIQMNGKNETPFNGSANQTVIVTPLKIGTFDTSNRLLFPNGNMMWIENNPATDTQQQISDAYNNGYKIGYDAGYNDGAASISGGLANASNVIVLISGIGTVTYTQASLKKITTAETAYDVLTLTEKNLVANYDDLTSARSVYDRLHQEVTVVINLIDAVGAVIFAQAVLDAIIAAEIAYNDLNANQKKGVTNYDVLIEARTAYDDLAAATPVIVLIDAIGAVAFDDITKDKIIAALNAYNALTLNQQALVANYNMLVVARNTYNALAAAGGGTLI